MIFDLNDEASCAYDCGRQEEQSVNARDLSLRCPPLHTFEELNLASIQHIQHMVG